ncbi:unnamed protein product [Leuciscus chuanchicus]
MEPVFLSGTAPLKPGIPSAPPSALSHSPDPPWGFRSLSTPSPWESSAPPRPVDRQLCPGSSPPQLHLGPSAYQHCPGSSPPQLHLGPLTLCPGSSPLLGVLTVSFALAPRPLAPSAPPRPVDCQLCPGSSPPRLHLGPLTVSFALAPRPLCSTSTSAC